MYAIRSVAFAMIFLCGCVGPQRPEHVGKLTKALDFVKVVDGVRWVEFDKNGLEVYVGVDEVSVSELSKWKSRMRAWAKAALDATGDDCTVWLCRARSGRPSETSDWRTYCDVRIYKDGRIKEGQ